MEFRQKVYEHAFTMRQDAQFELLGALLLSEAVHSFPELSLCPAFGRQWPSVYSAMEDGRQDSEWTRKFLAQQIQSEGVTVLALDASDWPRPYSRTLKDRQYDSSAVDGGHVSVGYGYSLLAWSAQAHSSWALPVDGRRIQSSQTAVGRAFLTDWGASPGAPGAPPGTAKLRKGVGLVARTRADAQGAASGGQERASEGREKAKTSPSSLQGGVNSRC